MARNFVACMAGVVMVAGAAQGSLVAYWAFPEPAQTPNYGMTWPIAADLSGNPGAILDTDAPKYDGSASPTALQQGSMQYFAGSTVNVQSPFTLAGQSISLRNDSLDRAQNTSLILAFSTLGFADLVLSYAERYTSTGPTNVTIQYSTDGSSYTPFTTYATVRSGAFGAAAQVVDLSAVDSLENISTAYLKITFTGFNANGTGAARIDNILVSTVPAAGPTALIGVAGLASSRRRRRC